MRDSPAQERTEHEAADREDRGPGREPGSAGKRETEEDDVAGHVCNEHVAEQEITEGVDKPGHNSEQQEDRRQKPVLVVVTRNVRMSGLMQLVGHERSFRLMIPWPVTPRPMIPWPMIPRAVTPRMESR